MERRLNEDRKNLVVEMVYKKMSAHPITRAYIESVKRYLPDDLKTDWEYECYYCLAKEELNDETIRRIADLITILFERRSKEEVSIAIREFVLSLDGSLEPCFEILKKFAPKQDVLGMLLYSRFSEIKPDDFDAETEFEKFYNHAQQKIQH